MTRSAPLCDGATVPGKLTRKMIDDVAHQIEQGNFVAVACRKVGISRQTFYDWREKGEDARKEGKHRSIYVRFLDRIEIAEAEAEAALVEKVMKTKRGPLEILKRRFRKRWGDKVVNEMTGPDGRPLEDAGSQNIEVHVHLDGQDDDPWNDLAAEEAAAAEGPGPPARKNHPPVTPPKPRPPAAPPKKS